MCLVERYVTDTAGKPSAAAAALGVTSLPEPLASPADLASHIQAPWAIESLHWLRDTCYRDDARAHTGSGPRVLAALRNLAIGALLLAGRHDITEATRWACRHMTRPFTILGLTLDLETAVAVSLIEHVAHTPRTQFR